MEQAQTIEQFKSFVADRFKEKAGMSEADAKKYASDCVDYFFEVEQVNFLDPGYDWTASGANEIVDAEMSYWDE